MDQDKINEYKGKEVTVLFQNGRFLYQVDGTFDGASINSHDFKEARIFVAGESIGNRSAADSTASHQSAPCPIGEPEYQGKTFSRISIDTSDGNNTLIALCELPQVETS